MVTFNPSTSPPLTSSCVQSLVHLGKLYLVHILSIWQRPDSGFPSEVRIIFVLDEVVQFPKGRFDFILDHPLEVKFNLASAKMDNF